MSIGLQIKRNGSETWRQCVERYAEREGLADECLKEFDSLVSSGSEPGKAAFDALYEWDCLDLYVDNERHQIGCICADCSDAELTSDND